MVERQIADMLASLEAEETEATGLSTQRMLHQHMIASDRSVMAKRRG
jgi:hypothetical protein